MIINELLKLQEHEIRDRYVVICPLHTRAKRDMAKVIPRGGKFEYDSHRGTRPEQTSCDLSRTPIPGMQQVFYLGIPGKTLNQEYVNRLISKKGC